jgi:excisionase family DNA binding protein
MSEEMNKATMSEQEFCSRVGISRITAWRMRQAGKLSHYRVGNKVLYGLNHIEEFLSNCECRAKRIRRSEKNPAPTTS